MDKITAPRGTQDIIPPGSRQWRELEAAIGDLADRFAYSEIRTPTFEATELFVRGVGETTDIVEKEMYTFEDRKGRSLTLRPEWTAGVVRAVLEHNLLNQGPLKLYYTGSIFRYERPQKGRYRQAHQFGVECLGYADAAADAEVIQLPIELLTRFGIGGLRVELNSIGDAVCRPAYRQALLDHFRPVADQLSADSQRRLERNPLRILDSKDLRDKPFIDRAPSYLDHLCADCQAHFATLRGHLDALGIRYAVNPRLVRGLDYYTRTVFEVHSDALGAQSTILGGGRYDGLVEQLGGPPTPAVGFAMGLERFLMVREELGTATESVRRGIQIIALGQAACNRLVPVLAGLRRVYPEPADMDYGDRKLGAQLKLADRNGARLAAICGDAELERGILILRDLETKEQREVTLPAGTDVGALLTTICQMAAAPAPALLQE
ncbi:histidine--tRNA ligase [bacterium]|nr:MAG: histidine--tRNA ligase [bacterium]